jgi:hypothetical protein
MRNSTLAIAAVLACASMPALAQDARTAPAMQSQSAPKAAAAGETPAALPSRFVFNRVDDGFLRLDNQNGKVTFCSPHTVGWSCQAVPEDHVALERELARLKDEVTGLKAQVAALRALSPRPQADLPPPAAADKSAETKKPPGDLARAGAAFENAWRRLVEIIVKLQKDMMHKS